MTLDKGQAAGVVLTSVLKNTCVRRNTAPDRPAVFLRPELTVLAGRAANTRPRKGEYARCPYAVLSAWPPVPSRGRAFSTKNRRKEKFMNQNNKLVNLPCLGSTGFKFSFLSGDEPATMNTLDFLCVALAKLSKLTDDRDPIIVESWRALDRACANGEKAGYERGYREGLAAGAAVSLGEDEIKRISKGGV